MSGGGQGGHHGLPHGDDHGHFPEEEMSAPLHHIFQQHHVLSNRYVLYKPMMQENLFFLFFNTFF